MEWVLRLVREMWTRSNLKNVHDMMMARGRAQILLVLLDVGEDLDVARHPHLVLLVAVAFPRIDYAIFRSPHRILEERLLSVGLRGRALHYLGS